MKAAVVRASGETPIYADFADPVPKLGEEVVSVTAAAMSHLVKNRASGTHYSAEGGFPFIAGVDGVGRLADGRRVYFLLPDAPYGAMAERVAVPTERIVPLPDDIDDIAAAALANPGMSSWAALTERARIAPGETALVNGATGTSGRLAVQIARQLGAAKVIATGRDAVALRDIAALGADATIVLDGDGETLKAAFEPHFAQGVDIVLDYLWGPSAERMLVAAAKAGAKGVPIRFVQIGSASGDAVSLPAAVLRSTAITMMGSGLGSISLARLVASIAGVFRAAGRAGFAVATKPVPLIEVTEAWLRDDSRRRTVFTIAQQERPPAPRGAGGR